MSSDLGDWRRTHSNGALRPSDAGRDVTLMGWVQTRRDLGGLIFIDLRDRDGITQIVSSPQESSAAAAAAEQVRSEYVIAVRGVVALRPAGTENARLPTGEIEVRARELRILNPAETPPFPIDDGGEIDETVRLRYRYLDLRRASMLKHFQLRHRLAKAVRDFLSAEGFLEVETPMLIKSTPEGARDFLVPSRLQPGKFFILPQSPQLFKQLLMVAGFDRYFQIVRCFRDEDLRADRQPEFTQVDIETSFLGIEDVLAITENMMAFAVHAAIGVTVGVPFPRITYQAAMDRYGGDKPDLRFGMEIVDCTDLFRDTEFQVFARPLQAGGVVRGFCVPGAASYSRKETDEVQALAREAGAAGVMPVHLDQEGARGPLAGFLPSTILAGLRSRLGARSGDLVLLVAGPLSQVRLSLGRLRVDLARKVGLIVQRPPGGAGQGPAAPEDLAFVWVTEFPLLERAPEGNRLAAVHHPFTAPMDEDLPLLEQEPLKVRAKAYDLVLNGVELGGGSIRIHRPDLQSRLFSVLGISPAVARERFGFLLDAFQYGAPPHGGIALGFDRMAMMLAGEESIREVIAFPKTQSGTDLMMGAPSEVDPQALEDAHIEIRRRPGPRKASP